MPREPRYPPIVRRHLIYHVYAARANDVWRQNVRALVQRWPQFDGKKVVAIATDADTHAPAEVLREFGPAVRDRAFQWFEQANSKRLREVATFPNLLARVRTLDPAAVFYGHTKGNTTKDGVYGATRWAMALYRGLLDNPGLVAKRLREFPFVGACKGQWDSFFGTPYPSKLKYGNWMFAGCFFWFRADVIFQMDWHKVPDDRYGAEAWPSGLFAAEEVCSIYQPWPEDRMPSPSPYDPRWYPPVESEQR